MTRTDILQAVLEFNFICGKTQTSEEIEAEVDARIEGIKRNALEKESRKQERQQWLSVNRKNKYARFNP